MARSGKISQLAQGRVDNTAVGGATVLTFTKFVHIGHSYGSILTSGLLAKYPDLTDGCILTGYIITPHTFQYIQGARGYQFAREYDPQRFGD